jgi:hypothetical protein
MVKTGWSRPFEDPITLPNGKMLVTLKDAANYIMKLPKAEQKHEKWQTALRCLIGVAEWRDSLMPKPRAGRNGNRRITAP